MAKLSILAGSTNKLIRAFFQDSSVTTGAGLTGLKGTSSGLTGFYVREGATASVSMTMSVGNLGTFSSASLAEVDATYMKGLYEFGAPNAALGTGAKSVVMLFQGATNLAPSVLEIELTAWDNQSTSGGLTGVGIDWAQVLHGTASNNLTQTTISNINGTAAATISGTAAVNVIAVLGTAATSAVGGALDVNAKYIGTSASSATQIGLSGQKIGNGTVGNASSTTSVITSATTPSNTVSGQFAGRVMIFDNTTTTTALRGQATLISTDNGSGTFTVAALTNAPVSGDTFTIT